MVLCTSLKIGILKLFLIMCSKMLHSLVVAGIFLLIHLCSPCCTLNCDLVLHIGKHDLSRYILAFNLFPFLDILGVLTQFFFGFVFPDFCPSRLPTRLDRASM